MLSNWCHLLIAKKSRDISLVWWFHIHSGLCISCRLHWILIHSEYAGFLQHDFDQGLGPYPEEIYENWRALSSHITESTLDRLSPIGKLISSSTQEGSETDVSSTANETVFYTSIDRLSWARNSTPEKVTSIALDKTPVLDAIVKSNLSGGMFWYAVYHMYVAG